MREVQGRRSVGAGAGRPAVTVLRATRPLVCGIVNVTPDSFCDVGASHSIRMRLARVRGDTPGT
jgi:hypothetical protein